MSKVIMIRMPDLLYRSIKARAGYLDKPISTVAKNVLEREFDCPLSHNRGRMSKAEKERYNARAKELWDEDCQYDMRMERMINE